MRKMVFRVSTGSTELEYEHFLSIIIYYLEINFQFNSFKEYVEQFLLHFIHSKLLGGKWLFHLLYCYLHLHFLTVIVKIKTI